MFLPYCLRVNQFCQGCCSWSMHAMSLFLLWLASWTCLLYRGAYHVFLWSMWWLAQAWKLGFVMLLILVSVLLLFWCHVNMMIQWDPFLSLVASVRMFWTCGYALNIHAPIWNYRVAKHVLILLYFCYKMFLADCLRVIQFCQGCCSCFIHVLNLLLPWIAS